MLRICHGCYGKGGGGGRLAEQFQEAAADAADAQEQDARAHSVGELGGHAREKVRVSSDDYVMHTYAFHLFMTDVWAAGGAGGGVGSISEMPA